MFSCYIALRSWIEYQITERLLFRCDMNFWFFLWNRSIQVFQLVQIKCVLQQTEVYPLERGQHISSTDKFVDKNLFFSWTAILLLIFLGHVMHHIKCTTQTHFYLNIIDRIYDEVKITTLLDNDNTLNKNQKRYFDWNSLKSRPKENSLDVLWQFVENWHRFKRNYYKNVDLFTVTF